MPLKIASVVYSRISVASALRVSKLCNLGWEISGLRFLASQNLTSNVKFWLADHRLLKFTTFTRFEAKNPVAA
jgi:hypothetical protein